MITFNVAEFIVFIIDIILATLDVLLIVRLAVRNSRACRIRRAYIANTNPEDYEDSQDEDKELEDEE